MAAGARLLDIGRKDLQRHGVVSAQPPTVYLGVELGWEAGSPIVGQHASATEPWLESDRDSHNAFDAVLDEHLFYRQSHLAQVQEMAGVPR